MPVRVCLARPSLMSVWNLPRVRFYRRALGYFRPDRWRLVLLMVLIALSTGVGLLLVWPLALLVDSVLVPTPRGERVGRWLPDALAASVPLQIALLAGATLALRLTQELLNMLRGLLSLQIGNNGLMRVRCDLFRKLQILNLQYHRSRPQGDSIYRLTNDTPACQIILNVWIEVAVAACTLLFMLGILLSRHATLTLVALAVVPLLLWTNVRYGRILKELSTRGREFETEFTSTIQRSMASIGLMQAFGREACEFDRFRRTVGNSLEAWYRLHWQAACYRLWVGLIFGGGAALIFGGGGWLVYRDQFLAQNPQGMTVGDLMVFLTYLGMLYDPLCKLSGAAANIQGGVAGAERIFEVLDREVGVADAPDALDLPLQPRTLTLDHVGFGYEPDKPVLRGVSATIRPGEMVAFVGSSGVGKSTLLNLLPRFYDPRQGSLQLDGIDIRDVRLRDLRRHVALVLQDSVTLPTTIAENIAYGRPGASDEQIRRAAELAGAAGFIEALPQGYETMLYEGGQNLSGGQRQRIAIARALLTEAPIIVLDEPTSSLDPQHERTIVETLRGLKGLRTIVIVSHRLSTVVDCDQIFVMHDGRIVGRGDHRTLLDRRGLYWEMARCQFQADPAPEPAFAA